MRTIGVYLLYTAVALRGLIRFWDNPGRIELLVALAAYGLLLGFSMRLLRAKGLPELEGGPLRRETAFVSLYLILQSALVMVLFRLGTGADFFALLFIPPSLQAVLFLGGRAGALWVAAFCISMLVGLRGVEPEPLFGPGMTVVYGGLCFLLGGYARQIRKAETARRENQRVLSELSTANAELERYADQVEELAAEHERTRLARELHDSVTQTAFSMNLAVQSARLLVDHNGGLLTGQLQRVEQLAASAIDEIQDLVSELSPRTAVSYDLVAALKRLAAEREQHDGLRVILQVTGAEELPAQAARQLYAIAQEALTNVVKHSGVCEAFLRLSFAAGRIMLEIEDKGRGFSAPMPTVGEGHMGLAGMRERACEIGWDFYVDSRPGSGTRVRVTTNGREGVA